MFENRDGFNPSRFEQTGSSCLSRCLVVFRYMVRSVFMYPTLFVVGSSTFPTATGPSLYRTAQDMFLQRRGTRGKQEWDEDDGTLEWQWKRRSIGKSMLLPVSRGLWMLNLFLPSSLLALHQLRGLRLGANARHDCLFFSGIPSSWAWEFVAEILSFVLIITNIQAAL